MDPDLEIISTQKEQISKKNTQNDDNLLRNQKKYNHFQNSIYIIRMLTFLSLSYTIVGIAFVWHFLFGDPSTDIENDITLARLGITLIVLGPLIMLINLLAYRGLTTWRRSLLKPLDYLVFLVCSTCSKRRCLVS